MTHFTARGLSVLAYAQGFTLWHYKHAGPLDQVRTLGFFDPANDQIQPGDHIHISAADGGTILFVAHDRQRPPVTVGAMR
jgi:hypothetical protein